MKKEGQLIKVGGSLNQSLEAPPKTKKASKAGPIEMLEEQ